MNNRRWLVWIYRTLFFAMMMAFWKWIIKSELAGVLDECYWALLGAVSMALCDLLDIGDWIERKDTK